VCLQLFHALKKALISATIIQPPDWHLPFEIMCGASDYAVGPVWWAPPYPTSLYALVWIPCCGIGRSGGLSLPFKTVPKSMVCVCIYTIAFQLSYNLSPKLSRGIDIVLFCLCPMDSITLGILLGYLLQLASVRLQIILFGLRTANNVLRPKHTGMRFMTHRAQWMQKHKFSVTCPNALFVKFVPVPPENEN
jgi:hypothetical protein